MHAYAADDPVFRAMNARGQRETSGALGNFCINCHAPMAVHELASTDGLNLDQLPAKLRGVTCFFCHTTQSVDGAHNNPLKLASDNVLAGSITDPFAQGRPHAAGYSVLLDRNQAESAAMCGSCHDIVSPHAAPIERTFLEWQGSAFAQSSGATCGQCHMSQSTTDRAVATVPGAPLRRTHSHTFAAVDVALTPFPDMQRQHDEIQSFLDSTLQTALCVEPLGGTSLIHVILDNVAAGHAFPSGAAQDRRAWTEVIAYDSAGNVLYSSGVVPDGNTPVLASDPDLWLLRDCMLDASKTSEVHMFWEAYAVEGNELPAQATFDSSDPAFYQTHKLRTFPAGASLPVVPDHVTLRVRLQPVGLEVVDDLIRSGDLDARFRSALPTFTVGGTLQWTRQAATHVYKDNNTGQDVFCVTATNLNVLADKFPAPVRHDCSP
jgi:hypothetical protein